MENVPAQDTGREFISPFSVFHNYRLNWADLPKNSRGLESKVGQLTERDGKVLALLAQCRIATSAQIGKVFWENPRTADGRLKMLARFGVLTRHTLESKRLTLIVYTLGPLGARLLNNTPFRQWWLARPVPDILARLAATQLYLRMRELGPASFYPVPLPFTGMIKINQAEYAVVAVRDVGVDFSVVHAARLLVIAETERQLLSIAPEITAPARFTTDERLFTLPVDRIFLSFNQERLTLDEGPPAQKVKSK